MTRTLVNRTSMAASFVLSFIALAMVIGALMVPGAHPQTDEGAQAHIFQFAMVVQLPVLAIFVATADWSPPRRPLMLSLLGAQLAGIAAAFGSLYLSGL